MRRSRTTAKGVISGRSEGRRPTGSPDLLSLTTFLVCALGITLKAMAPLAEAESPSAIIFLPLIASRFDLADAPTPMPPLASQTPRSTAPATATASATLDSSPTPTIVVPPSPTNAATAPPALGTATPSHEPGPPTNLDANCVVEETYDALSDGAPDATARTTYNAMSKPASRDRDAEADGVVDSRETFSYDEMGSIVRYTRESLPSAELQVADTYVYDDLLRLSRVERYTWAAGRATPAIVTTYSYNAESLVQRREVVYYDPPRREVTTYEHDPSGNTLREIFDIGGDGRSDLEHVNVWRTGLLVERRTLIVGTGARRATSYRYDADRRLESTAHDNNNDGMIDAEWKYFYGPEDGLLRRWEYYVLGDMEKLQNYEYDRRGRLITLAIWVAGDGTDTTMYYHKCP